MREMRRKERQITEEEAWAVVDKCEYAFLAMTAADIVAGSVIIEQVFAIPGLGRLLLTSIANRDFPVVQAIVVILALLVVLVNCIADIVNQQLDPRLRLR